MVGPMSAFAARKAVRNPIRRVASPVVEDRLGTTDTVEETEALPRPRKRQKTGKQSGNSYEDAQRSQKNGGFIPIEKDAIAVESSPSEDEMEVEENNSDSGILVHSAVPVQRLSTFVPTKNNVLSDTNTEWTVRLQPRDSLAILGQYDIWVRSGAISILGAIVHASSKLHRIYAPSTHSIPPIRPVPNPYGTGNPPCEVSIISCGSRLRMLKQIAPKFGRIWNDRSKPEGMRRSFVNLQSSADDPHKRPLRLLEPPADWQISISKLVSANDSKHPVAVMVCGPKGAGKSTFCRMLVNALLPKVQYPHQAGEPSRGYDTVAFLDLDPGQPEFSPPGELSLLKVKAYNLGPPSSHPAVHGDNEVIRSHHFGYLSPKDDPRHYYQCALDLYSYYRRMAICPLIVNCSGWVQGSGLVLLNDLVHGLDLTGIIYMSATGPEEVVDALGRAANQRNIPLHQLTSQVSEFATRTAADLRMMSTLSYFHMDGIEGLNVRWNASPLASMAPLVVHYAGPNQGIMAAMVLGDEKHSDTYGSLLEGCVIGIVVVEQDSVDSGEKIKEFDAENMSIPGSFTQVLEQDSEHVSGFAPILRTSTDIPYLRAGHHAVHPLLPESSHSLGQAIIRGVDPFNKTFHLLTPIPSATFQGLHQQNRQIMLVRGKLDTPTWAYTEQLALDKGRRLRRERETGEKEGYEPEDIRDWAERQPWASVVEGGRSGSGKVRRIRRDIRYRGQGNGDVGSGH